jgi:hypothetical protein
LVEGLQRATDDGLFVIANGPLGSLRAKCGRAFFVGPGLLTRISPITGAPETLKPVRVRLVTEQIH